MNLIKDHLRLLKKLFKVQDKKIKQKVLTTPKMNKYKFLKEIPLFI